MTGRASERARVAMRQLAPEAAVQTFADVSLGYSAAEAMREARRGRGGDFSTARSACPFEVDVAELVRLIDAGDFDGALSIVMRAHPWPGVLGRWCHGACEAAHSLPGREPLNIKGLERAAADHARSWPAFMAGAPTGKAVAILGAGSAASATAYRLRQHGHAVAMFERLPLGGGMKTVGFPNFRLPLDVVQRENALKAWGVETHFGVELNDTIVRALLDEHDAVVAGTGKFREAPLGVPGEELAGVHDALDFFTRVKLEKPPRIGARVAIFGAGYSALDASRTVRRLGSEATIYYRRAEEDMPVYPARRALYLQQQRGEGITVEFQVTPLRILGRDGRVAGVELVRTKPGARDASGRAMPESIAGSEFIVDCDTVIAAIGEVADLSYLPRDVRTTPDGHVWTDPKTFATSLPGLYAVGEMTGLKGTVAALRAGFACGDAIDRVLEGTP